MRWIWSRWKRDAFNHQRRDVGPFGGLSRSDRLRLAHAVVALFDWARN